MLNRKIKDLPNLGAVSAQLLAQIGIRDEAALREMGVVEAYAFMKAQGLSVSLNLLWAMYGAIHGMKWTEVSAEIKSDLIDQVNHFSFMECA